MDNTKETGMSFLEYKDKEEKILNAHAKGSITMDAMYKLLEDNRKAYDEWREYRRNHIDVTSIKERPERVDEARRRMRARRDEIANRRAKAYAEDGKIKVRKDRKYKDGLPIRAKYGLNGFAKAVADVKKGGDR